ncbi:MAG: hypothetical protein ACREXI_15150 [Caldimonas sp.]
MIAASAGCAAVGDRMPLERLSIDIALVATALVALASNSRAQSTDAQLAARTEQLPAVQVQHNYINSVGSSDAASEGTVTARLATFGCDCLRAVNAA